MIYKSIDSITLQDIESLISSRVIEDSTLEFKKTIDFSSDKSKIESLKDISAFANYQGGDLIIGVNEDKSHDYPYEIVGIEINDIDDFKLQIENLLRDSIEPRIIGIAIKEILFNEKKFIIIIRIPPSLNLPHWVKYNKENKFYMRNNSGKHPMDIDELRIAFNHSGNIINQIKEFVDKRIKNIYCTIKGYNISNRNLFEISYQMIKPSNILIQVIPLIAMKQKNLIHFNITRDNIPNIFGSYNDVRLNIDGLMGYNKDNSGLYYSYTQIYHNGIIECCNSSLLTDKNTKGFCPNNVEEKILTFYDTIIQLYKQQNISVPIIIFITLLGVHDYNLTSNDGTVLTNFIIDRDVVNLPEVIIENIDTPSKVLFQDCFNALSNAFGLEVTQRKINK